MAATADFALAAPSHRRHVSGLSPEAVALAAEL